MERKLIVVNTSNNFFALLERMGNTMPSASCKALLFSDLEDRSNLLDLRPFDVLLLNEELTEIEIESNGINVNTPVVQIQLVIDQEVKNPPYVFDRLKTIFGESLLPPVRIEAFTKGGNTYEFLIKTGSYVNKKSKKKTKYDAYFSRYFDQYSFNLTLESQLGIIDNFLNPDVESLDFSEFNSLRERKTHIYEHFSKKYQDLDLSDKKVEDALLSLYEGIF